MRKLPWIEQQELLLSLVQTLNSTLVLNQVLEQVLDAIMHITAAERGFLPVIDIAYHGFEHGIEEDGLSVRLFAERCPHVFDVCRHQQPDLFKIGNGQRARCWLKHHPDRRKPSA